MTQPKGTIDYHGRSAAVLQFAIEAVTGVFRRNGGEFLETPIFENRETLLGKYGAEAETKLVYDVAENGGHALSLRYDLTVPFVRFAKQHGVTRMRRYSVGKVFRRDQPSKSQGRYREFYQADFDVVGEHSTDGMAEILVLDMIADIFDALGLEHTVVANTTQNLWRTVVGAASIAPEAYKDVCASIDKLDSKPWDAVADELLGKGLDAGQVCALKTALEGPSEIPQWAPGTRAKVSWSPTLARGLDYYNGLIFEVKVPGFPTSVAAGGRYGLFGPDVPAIGFSVGLTRLLDVVSPPEPAPGAYHLTTMGVPPTRKLEIVEWCRRHLARGDPFTWCLSDRKLARVLSEQSKRGTRWLVIVGERELTDGVVTVKDLKLGTQTTIPRH